MPSRDTYAVRKNKDGTVTLEYRPTEKGLHELNIHNNDRAVEGTPFRCHVDGAGSSFVTAFGDGLSFGSCGKEADFNIVGGGSKVDVAIEGPNKTEFTKTEKDGCTHVAYTPISPGEYDISIKKDGKHIHGSPFNAKVTGEGRKRSQLMLTATSVVTLGGNNPDLTGMVGQVHTPAGQSEPVLLKKTSDGKLALASFAPKSKGTYSVEVTQDGGKVPGSPFNVQVNDNDVACAAKVQLAGAYKEMEAGKWNEFTVDLGHAGHGALGISFEGAHRVDLEEREFKERVYKIAARPHEPGLYVFNIRFADDHVTGSPIMLNVKGEPSGRIREAVTKAIKPVEYCGAGTKCEFQLKIPGTEPLDMEASLTSPNGKTELCEIRDMPGSMYDIKFTPAEEGVHIVSLKHRGLHCAGSPFQYTVGQPSNAGAYKVEVGGPGMERGEVGRLNEFNIYTREAGGGELYVGVEGPSKAELDVVDRGHGYTTVSYKVSKEGDYGIHIKFDDEHVPDSPCNVHIVPHAEGANKVEVIGLKDRGLEINKHVTFNVNLNGARGALKCHLDTPSGTEEDIFLQELDRDLHAVRFIPHENGIYYVHIKLNEAHIPGSPFPMLIGTTNSDPALVLANGDGLTKAVSGSIAKFKVVTTNAGAGTLLVQITGASKVAIQCTEKDDGYEFSYTPMAPGSYFINIKYCNITIAGCPSKAVVTGPNGEPGSGKASDMTETSALAVETSEKKEGAVTKKRFHSDASKIMVKGTGLKKAFFNRAATFTIDVTGAGNAILTAGMMSATGNPVEEFNLKKSRPTQYTVTYKTKEKGEHNMIIRWGADDVPGSPFTIPCA